MSTSHTCGPQAQDFAHHKGMRQGRVMAGYVADVSLFGAVGSLPARTHVPAAICLALSSRSHVEEGRP